VYKAISSGKVDGGFALVGPNKAGFYTGVAAIAVDDPTSLEKAARASVKAAPDEFAKRIRWEATKVAGVPVHTFQNQSRDPAGEVFDQIFGKEQKFQLAFGKDAVYAAIGPDAEAELKRAMALKPATGTAFDLTAHAARAVKLLPPGGFTGEIAAIGGRIPGFISYTGLDVAGGKELRVSVKTGMVLSVAMIGVRAQQNFQAVPGAVPPPPPPPPLPIKKN
jgi:hypothetical protein